MTFLSTVSIVGPDRARYRINGEGPVNEIEDFWSARYLSAGEAVWRILGFAITRKDPAVTALPIHLPGSPTHRQYLRRAGNSSSVSKLDRYFYRPAGSFTRDNVVRTFASLSYTEYYKLFRHQSYSAARVEAGGVYWESNLPAGEAPMMVIQRDVTRPHITRIDSVRPSAGERFYLRLMLSSRPATSFLDARTVNGVAYDTFQEAAIAFGLFDEQNEADYALQEAVVTRRTPRQIRVLFIHLLMNDCIQSPIHAWETFRDALCQDFYLQNNNNRDVAEEYALRELSHYLEEYGKTLDSFGLPEPAHQHPEILHELERWGSDPEGQRDQVDAALEVFNPEQRAIFDQVKNALDNHEPLQLFVDGKAGRGKTFLVNAICSYIRSRGKIVIPTATSAHAARLYTGGRTTHSAFKVCSSFTVDKDHVSHLRCRYP